MKVKNSLLKRSLAGNLVLLALLTLLGIYMFHGNMENKKWPNTIYYAARIRFNGILMSKNLQEYYVNVCLEGRRGEEYTKNIEKTKNIISEVLTDFSEGKRGVIGIKSISNREAQALFGQIKEGYEKIFQLSENFLKSCDVGSINQLDDLAEDILNKAQNFVPLLVKQSEREIFIHEVITYVVYLFIIALVIFNYFILRNSLQESIRDLTEWAIKLEKGDFKEYKSKVDYEEFKPLKKALSAVSRNFASFQGSNKLSGLILTDQAQLLKEKLEVLGADSIQLESLIEMTVSIGQEVTDLLSRVERSTEEMKAAITEISQNTTETAQRAKEVRLAASEMEETVVNLKKAMERIREITGIIEGIAEQTNLLALNASIEAARAGEAGKGFAVVANEVKELAKKVQDFTKEIASIVQELDYTVVQTVNKAEKTKEMVDEVEKATTTIAGAVEEQTAVTNSIVESTLETKERSFSMTTEIENLRKVAEDTKKVVELLNVESKVISEISTTFKIINNLFNLEEKPLTDEDLNNFSVKGLLNLAIGGHVNWKMQFLNEVMKGLVPKVERDHRKCLLGRSMDILKRKLMNKPAEKLLVELEEPHARLHGLVERFEREVNRNNSEEIIDFINKEVLVVFDEVMTKLHEVKDFCEKHACD